MLSRLSDRFVRLASTTAIALVAAGAAFPAAAQEFESYKVDLLSRVQPGEVGANEGNDCWGYTSSTGREYALMGFNNKLAVIEVTDPTNPVVISTINHNNSTWGDVKVFGDYCYFVNESGGGIQSIDLSNVDGGSATLMGTFGPSTSHNIAINEESGFLYTIGSGANGGRAVVYDLNADPINPPEAGRISSAEGDYLHDAHIVMIGNKEIMFGASEGRGVDIFDVTDKSDMVRLSRTSYPGVEYCHQLWSNDDHSILYVDDELDEYYGRVSTTRTLVFDVSDLTAPVLISTFTTGLPAIDHNLYFHEDLIYEANYTSGLRIFDASVDPFNPVEVAYFDTHPASNGASFNGDWSVFPFFESGTIIISDINLGMFVVSAGGALSGLEFDYPDGRPEMIDPAGGSSFRLDVTGRGVAPKPNSGILYYNDGNGWNETPLSHLGNNEYDVIFPATECGEIVQYYVSAETETDVIEYDPSSAPAKVYDVLSAGSLDEIFADNFQTNKGWSVENEDLQDGAWERGVPVGDGSRGDPTKDYDGSGSCYLTGNREGNSDVDGGPTRLISPLIDLSEGDARISFAELFFNDDGDADSMLTEITNDDGANWTYVRETFDTTGGWVERTFKVSDYVAPTANVRIRISVSDNPNDSVTEAAIDEFIVERTDCQSDCLELNVDALVAGQASNFTLSRGTPNARGVVLYGFDTGLFEKCNQGGLWCVSFGIDIPANKALQRIVVQGTFNNAGTFSKSRFIPKGTSGVRILMQAAQSGTYPDPCMSNIHDAVIE